MNKQNIIFIALALCLLACHATSAITVNTLSGVSSDNLVYSGSIPVAQGSDDQLFFTYYGKDGVSNEGKLKEAPLIVVVGTSGSSAQYLNLGLMGPITLNNDMTTTANENRVTKFANVMFIDLLGSGFSFVANPETLPTKFQEYGVHLTYAINALAAESDLGKSSIVVLAGQGTFMRALPGLDDINTLSGIIHLSAWPDLNAFGKYYGVAGIDLKIFANSERYAIESTYLSCYNYLTNKKYLQAHDCYDSILNFVELKTKNANLYDVSLGSNLTEHLPMIQYYFSQSSTISLYKAPNSKIFQAQSNWISKKTYEDLATNKTSDLSQFMKDYLSVRHFFVSGDKDYIAYRVALKNWIETQLNFIDRDTFVKAKLDDIQIDGKTVAYGKEIKQVKYVEVLDSGHYVYSSQGAVMSHLLKDWVESLTVQQHIRQEESASSASQEQIIAIEE